MEVLFWGHVMYAKGTDFNLLHRSDIPQLDVALRCPDGDAVALACELDRAHVVVGVLQRHQLLYLAVV